MIFLGSKLENFQKFKSNVCFFDIETTSLDSCTGKILDIGVRINGQTYIFSEKYEWETLENFLGFLNEKQPTVLVGHNIFNFDLPFLYDKMEQYGLKPLWHTKWQEQYGVSGTEQGGKPLFYTPNYSRNFFFVDTLHLVAKYDYVSRHLSSYGLKQSVLEIGLRSKQRLELTAEEIQKTANCETRHEYLKYDLEDTELLFDFLYPSYYYQLQYLPNERYNYQNVVIKGTGRKWEDILEVYYEKQRIFRHPNPDSKRKYKGAFTMANTGLYKGKVAKLDISSLYPSIMLGYGIFSRKDIDGYMQKLLEYLTDLRLNILKPKAKQGNIEANQMQSAVKVFINSAYGFLGTGGLNYNDMRSAEKITAKGRGIVKVMMRDLEKAGCRIIEVDTDGIIFQYPEEQAIFKARELFHKHLPDFIKEDLEFKFDNGAVFCSDIKNYLVFNDKKKIVITKGVKWRGRDKAWFEKDLPIHYIKAFLRNPKRAEFLENLVLVAVQQRTIKPKKLAITRKIRKGEKTLLALGKQEGETITYWWALDRIGKRGKRYYKPTDKPEEYDPKYYIDIIKKKLTEVKNVLGVDCETVNDRCRIGKFGLLFR